MRCECDDADKELLLLAGATDRVADTIADICIKSRLRAIAAEVRALARRGRASASDEGSPGTCYQPA